MERTDYNEYRIECHGFTLKIGDVGIPYITSLTIKSYFGKSIFLDYDGFVIVDIVIYGINDAINYNVKSLTFDNIEFEYDYGGELPYSYDVGSNSYVIIPLQFVKHKRYKGLQDREHPYIPDFFKVL